MKTNNNILENDSRKECRGCIIENTCWVQIQEVYRSSCPYRICIVKPMCNKLCNERVSILKLNRISFPAERKE